MCLEQLIYVNSHGFGNEDCPKLELEQMLDKHEASKVAVLCEEVRVGQAVHHLAKDVDEVIAQQVKVPERLNQTEAVLLREIPAPFDFQELPVFAS